MAGIESLQKITQTYPATRVAVLRTAPPRLAGQRTRQIRRARRTSDTYVGVADEIMSILCDKPRLITNPNTLVGGYFAADLPDISPDDQRPIDNTQQQKLRTNAYSWRAVFFSKPQSYKRTSALQVAETLGRVRYMVNAADTGERISVSLDLRLEECLRPAYRRIQVDQVWCLVSLLGEPDDERGPEATIRGMGVLEEGDEVLAIIQVSADRNMMLVGRSEGGGRGGRGGKIDKKRVLMVVSELVQQEDHGGARWRLASIDTVT